ncbi:MAG: glycosyltransferase [Oscillospiraceae bacterium]
MDGYCIPHPALLEEFAAAGLDPSRLHATGIPVSPDFIRPLDKQTARRALHLENKRHVVVLACGSMGAGPMRSAAEKIARELSPSEDNLVMVCGSNRRLYRSSKLTLEEYPQIQVVGFTKRMPLYLHGCDALVTKAGVLPPPRPWPPESPCSIWMPSPAVKPEIWSSCPPGAMPWPLRTRRNCPR